MTDDPLRTPPDSHDGVSGADESGTGDGQPGPTGDGDARRARLLARVRDVPDFPKPGIVFKDITPLLADHATFTETVEALAAPFRDRDVDTVAGIEARGFVLGAPVALALGAGFVPVRKQGKLPGDIVSASYDLEYGSAVIEVTSDAFVRGARVLVVDDVLATGGTAAATVDLVRRCGGEVVGVSMLMELSFLDGRTPLAAAGVADPHILLRI
jgi:adenine phosphoribosyltransferase